MFLSSSFLFFNSWFLPLIVLPYHPCLPEPLIFHAFVVTHCGFLETPLSNCSLSSFSLPSSLILDCILLHLRFPFSCPFLLLFWIHFKWALNHVMFFFFSLLLLLTLAPQEQHEENIGKMMTKSGVATGTV